MEFILLNVSRFVSSFIIISILNLNTVCSKLKDKKQYVMEFLFIFFVNQSILLLKILTKESGFFGAFKMYSLAC